MATADELIQTAWRVACPNITLWNTFTPVDADSTPVYPMAEIVPSGYSEDEMLSHSQIETHRFDLSITDTSRRAVWNHARAAKTEIEKIDDPNLVESDCKIDDFATPWDGGGRQMVWELKMTVTIQLFQKG